MSPIVAKIHHTLKDIVEFNENIIISFISTHRMNTEMYESIINNNFIDLCDQLTVLYQIYDKSKKDLLFFEHFVINSQ